MLTHGFEIWFPKGRSAKVISDATSLDDEKDECASPHFFFFPAPFLGADLPSFFNSARRSKRFSFIARRTMGCRANSSRSGCHAVTCDARQGRSNEATATEVLRRANTPFRRA